MTRKDSRRLLVLAAVSLACALGTGCSSGDDDSAPCKDCVYPATGGSSPSPIPTEQQVGSGQQAPPSGTTGGNGGTGGTATGGTGASGGTVGGAFGGTGGTDMLTGGTLGFGGSGGTFSTGGTVGNTLTGGTTNTGATGGI